MNTFCFPAHIRRESEGSVVQTVEEHCRHTAEYTATALKRIGLEKTGDLLGIIHDLGKMTGRFADYIQRASNGEAVRRGSVNHTFAAVKLFSDKLRSEDMYDKLIAELISFAVGSHHGLFDSFGPDRKNGFAHRLNSENELFAEAAENFFGLCCSRKDLSRKFDDARAELTPKITQIIKMASRDNTGDELSFYFGSLGRLLLSALIEGDRRDTTAFMSGTKLPFRESVTAERWGSCLAHLEERLQTFPIDTELQRARAELSRRCGACGERRGGIYRLNLPTGAGKTLSSLRFALAHAARNQKSRIIFASPLLSILEQNAAVIRACLGEDNMILEHHSNVVRAEASREELSLKELLTETWDAPIVITTLVQLLNTLFSGEAAAIRRFHALCDSIIVIDEIQTLPLKLLSMFQLMASFLAEICGATIVLCSATQPAHEYTRHPFALEPEELIPYDKKIWDVFRRTLLREAQSVPLAQIPDVAEQALESCDSLLIVCNKKDEAAYLYQKLQNAAFNCFHLSASMCAAHRRETLEALRASMKEKTRKTVCVSTQVIEAGVDISFGCVIRLAAGMDNVIQSAGRCNRNGELQGLAPVYILNCADENLSALREIKRAKDATEILLAEYRKDEHAFDGDLSSDRAIRLYYKALYREMEQGAEDYPVEEHGSLFDLLSSNTKYATENAECYGDFFLCQAFKTAGSLFSVFDTQTESLLVPYGEGADIIGRIREIGDRFDPEAVKELRLLLERAKPYTVSVFSYQIAQLEKQGALDRIGRGSIPVLQPDYFGEIPYSDEIGLYTKER